PALRRGGRARGCRGPPPPRPAERGGEVRRPARPETRARRGRRAWPAALVAMPCVAFAPDAQPAPVDPATTVEAAAPGTRPGPARYQAHCRHAPSRLADPDSDVLPLFGYVVEALREAHLPTEYALIPFVESGYAPGARNAAGPAGLWQFITQTARDQGVPVHK